MSLMLSLCVQPSDYVLPPESPNALGRQGRRIHFFFIFHPMKIWEH